MATRKELERRVKKQENEIRLLKDKVKKLLAQLSLLGMKAYRNKPRGLL
jgi:hypothetical protein